MQVPNKDANILLRIAGTDKARIRDGARRRGLTVSEFIRATALKAVGAL